MPGTVGDVVRRRLDRLPGPTVDLLGVAAVIGRDVDLDLLARSAELDASPTLDRLDPAVVHRLLVEVPERPAVVRFSHALVREVLLDDLTSLRRARLHLKVADAIEAARRRRRRRRDPRRAPLAGRARRRRRRAAEALERAAEVAVRRVAYRPPRTCSPKPSGSGGRPAGQQRTATPNSSPCSASSRSSAPCATTRVPTPN